MKKFRLFLIALLTLTLCACSSTTPSTTTAGSMEAEETESSEETVNDFGTILDKYCLAYTENWSNIRLREEQVSCFRLQEDGASVDDFGFVIMDVDGDGSDELIIGLMDGTADAGANENSASESSSDENSSSESSTGESSTDENDTNGNGADANGITPTPLCGIYYNLDGFCDTYGVSYADGFKDQDGMYTSFAEYYLTFNEESGNYDLLTMTQVEDSDELLDGDGDYYAYDLAGSESGYMSWLLGLTPDGIHADGSVGWILNEEATPAGESTQAVSETELTQEEAESMINGWMENAFTPEYHPLRDWMENPVLEEYMD